MSIIEASGLHHRQGHGRSDLPPRNIKSSNPWGASKTAQAAGWAFCDQAFKYLVHLDPSFDNNRNSAVDRRGVVNEGALAVLEARTQAGRGDDPQRLAQFLASDRRMILYHGYSDGFINPFRTIRFYEDWARLTGGYDVLRRNARLFMVPGMYHCSKGPGPNFFDALGALEQWIEHGRAPEEIVATKYTNDDAMQPPLRTMPLCSFPTQARYAGTGDVNRAASWACTANQDLLQIARTVSPPGSLGQCAEAGRGAGEGPVGQPAGRTIALAHSLPVALLDFAAKAAH